jgi:hypothetical protein
MITPHAACAVRRWVGLYTRGLPADLRDGRRDEVEADLWSHVEDSRLTGRSDRSTAAEILVRLVAGLPADVTWRLEKRGHDPLDAAEPRVAIPGSPAIGVLAILGGLLLGTALLALFLAMAVMGPIRPWSDPVLGLVLFFGLSLGELALAVAVISLVVRNQDRLPRIGAVGGGVAFLAGFFGALGAYQLVGLLAAGSAVLAWQLRSIGALDRRVAASHIASAIAFSAVVLAAVTGADIERLGFLVLPYPATWVAIGYSLIRGRAVRERAPQP